MTGLQVKRGTRKGTWGSSLMVQEANGVNIINRRAPPICVQMIKPLREGPMGEALNMSLG